MTDFVQLWVYLSSTPLFGLTATLVTYVIAQAFYQRAVAQAWQNTVADVTHGVGSALLGAFGANQVRFHHGSGEGYRFIADQVLALDRINPQISSRIVSVFNRWRRFDADRQSLMKAELERIMATEGLSKDVYEIVSKALA